MTDGATGPILRLAEPPEAPPKLDPFGDEEGTLVLRCPGMSAEDKFAWGFARERSGWPYEPNWDWGGRKFKISAREIAEHQNVDSASGRRRRNNLADRWKLIEVHHRCAVSGDWTVSLVRPSLALAEQLGFVAADPQQQLPGIDPVEKPSEQATSESRRDGVGDAPACSDQPRGGSAVPLTVPPTPSFSVTAETPLARAPSGHKTSVVSDLSTDIDIGNTSGHLVRLSTAKDLAGSHRGGSAHGSADPTDDVSEDELHRQWQAKRTALQQELRTADGEPVDLKTTAAMAAAIVRRLPDERSQSMARERWISLIRRTVDDPGLKVSPCVKVACAIVDGRLKAEIVEEIFAELRKQRQAGTLRSAGAYFVGSAQKAFSRLGLEWERPKPK